MRERLNRGMTRKKEVVQFDEESLRRVAPTDWLMRVSSVAALVLIVFSWNSGRPLAEGLTGERQGERLARFVTKLTPEPARPADRFAPVGERWQALQENRGAVGKWAGDLWVDRGAEALGNTMAIASAAIVLAALGAEGDRGAVDLFASDHLP